MSAPRVNLLGRKVVAPPLPTAEQFSSFVTFTLLGGLALWCASAVLLVLAVRQDAPWLALPCLLCNVAAFVFIARRFDGNDARTDAALEGLTLHELMSLVGHGRPLGIRVGQIFRAMDRRRA